MQLTYPALTSYLKGLHLTLDSWRPGRDKDGWKISSKIAGFDADSQWDVHPEDGQGPAYYPSQPPDLVLPVPRYEDDLAALRSLTQLTTPPLRYVRRKAVHTVVYGFVDASGHGFGSSLMSTTGVSYTMGGTMRANRQTIESYIIWSQPWSVTLSTVRLQTLRCSCLRTIPPQRQHSIRGTPPVAVCSSWSSACGNWRCTVVFYFR